MPNLQQKIVSAFIPGLGVAYQAVETGNKAIKSIFFFILVILSIVALAGASKSKSTPKGKFIVALNVFIFLMTLGLFFRSQLKTNTNIVIYLVVYWTLALLSTILQKQNVKKVTKGEQKGSKDSSNSTLGIVVIIGIYLLGSVYAFHIGHSGIKDSAREYYFLK